MTILLAGAATFALAAPAFAAQPADAAMSDGADSGLGDIIVTAQRRAERMQDVPISITAANAAKLSEARVENISNIQAISPSVAFRVTNISSSSANLIIRGLGTSGNSRSFEGSVGVFIDGVYRTRAAAALQNFLDIGNLQILRGPQGTLFGKNTTAGAILLSSTDPSLDEASGMVDLGYGNFNSVLVKAAANVPLGDKVAVRIAGLVSHTAGFYRDATTGDRLNDDSTQAVKGQLLLEPTDSVSIRIIGDYSRSSGNCCYATSDFINGPTQPLVDALTLANGGVVPPRDGKLHFLQTINGNGQQVIEDYGGTLLIDADIGPGTLKSVTAWRKFNLTQRDMDGEFVGADIYRYNEDFHSRFVSQELTYTTHIAPLNGELLVGAFFSDEKLNMPRVVTWGSQAQAFWDGLLELSGVPAGTVYAPEGPWYAERQTASAKSYAGFAHLDVKVGERVNLIAGVRYSVEKKRGAFGYDFYRPEANDPMRFLGRRPGPAYDVGKTDKAVSGTLGIQYRPVDDVMLYATYNRGFKAGGVNVDANAAGGRANNPDEFPGAQLQDPRYKPEKVNAFEVGAKTEYFNRRARTNIAFFYYDVSDMQVAQYVGLQFTVLNAKSAKDYGVEIENLFQLTNSLTLGLDGTWIPRAKYGDDPLLDPVLQNSRFRFTPKLQGNATLNLDQPIADNLDLTARLQYQYSGRQFISTASRSERGELHLVNANLGLRLPDSRISVEGWALNLFNKTYVSQSFATPFQTGDENAYLGAPRTFGIRLHAEF